MKKSFFFLSITLTLAFSAHAEQFELAQTPIFVNSAVPPLNMLVMSRDHTLYYEAYNDASDLNGDGVVDVGYKPEINYYGYFNSNVCYDYTGSTGTATTQAAEGGRFIPKSHTSNKQCNGSWSGDFLNYLTTSRMDALRRVLYGGRRAVDTTTQTTLEAAYIPRDGHAWGKSYDPARDSYQINKYTPLSKPASNTRHLFAVTTLGVESSNRTQLRVLKDTDWQVWDWVSRESNDGQGGEKCGSSNQTASNGKKGSHNCGTTTGYNVRVDVCTGITADLREETCKLYPNSGGDPIYKPTGLLHDFGEKEQMYFGLLTGSYEKNIAGGALRRNISNFAEEVDLNTGQFRAGINGIVANIDRLKVIDFNSSNFYDGCNWNSNYHAYPIDYAGGNSADCAMWGNPVAEMMFETLRYFSGADSAHTLYDYGSGSSKDKTHSLSKPTWAPPYAGKEGGGGGFQYCARPVMTVLSDINPSYDYKLPGSRYDSIDTQAAALSSFNVSSQVDAIGVAEGIHGGSYFIGQSDSGNADDAPTPKLITNLSYARGLSPEEPSKRGTYYSAGVARYGATNKIAGTSDGRNEVMTYAVALASPLPQIRIPVGTGHVTVVPFAKSVKSDTNPAIDISRFVPTNPIVDYYVDRIANTGASNADAKVNGGRPFAKFIINYEDQEVGSDHDMDAIAEYTVALQDDGTVKVDVATTFKAGSTVQQMGYVISGTDKDGIYIEIQDTQKKNVFYELNTPKDRDPGYCIGKNSDDSCKKLPTSTSRTFTPSASSSTGEFLKDPLWYAAKYGMPDRNPADITGNPDNYFLVTNALNLKAQLTKAFNDIMQKNASVTSPAVSRAPQGPTISTDRDLYRTEFDAETWTGKLIKETLDLSTNTLEHEWDASIPSSGREVMMANVSGSALQDFTWDNLSGRTHAGNDLQATLSQDDDLGSERVNFIKGNAGHGDFRDRPSLLGDIVNSSPVLVAGAQYLPYLANQVDGGDKYGDFATTVASRTQMIYVGANDGMLHGFDAETGEEKFAFVPTPVIENLHKLTSPDYVNTTDEVNNSLHQYYVDGALSVADVYINSAWRTVLVGTLGAGGIGAFALDITEPDEIKLLWEFTVDNPDSKASEDSESDLGHIFGAPVIARLHDENWSVLLNNGYNSPNAASGNAVLFVINIADGSVTHRLAANNTGEHNGLSAVKAADNNGDGIADYAYAGDLQGNLWRFDLFSQKASTGSDPFLKTEVTPGASVSYSGKPLYTATNTAGTPQPITVQPNLVRHPSGSGYIIVFGTGRYLADKDKVAPYTMQSVYGIWDSNTKGESVGITAALTRSDLLEQEFTHQSVESIGADGIAVTRTIRLLSENQPSWAASKNCQTNPGSHCGWYLDLGVDGTADGERMVDTMETRGEVLFFSTRQPSDDPCTAGMDAWNYGINPATGGRTKFTVFDLNSNRTVGIEDNYGDDPATSQVISGFKTPPGGFALTDGKIINPDGTVTDINLGASAQGRQSWYIVPVSQAE